jgi:pyrimidine deaminase RibD-like protein
MFCVSSVENVIKYYDIFQRKKLEGLHNLRIATIFSYATNEDDADANGFLPEELSVVEEPAALFGLQVHSREKLDEFIGHYNTMFETKFSTKDSESFYNYYNDISKKVKERKIDILLVVNMFLTGFDSQTLNTMYVDKNLKYHGLIQAYSRTNRILNEQKSQGNIIVFRNLKNATDQAITLFSNKEAIEVIIMKPYEDYVAKFDESFERLLSFAPTVNSVNDLNSEDEELEFIKAFRELMRIKNILTAFSDFKWEDLAMAEQLFEDYKSKYGPIPEGSIVLTTCSPCSEHMTERDGPSCTDYINNSIVKKVYCGYSDPTQDEEQREFNILETKDAEIRELCKMFAETFIHGVNENFADGRNPQDKGDAKRHGINTKASVSSLRKTAKQGGRKGQLAHWLANMKAGRAKHAGK